MLASGDPGKCKFAISAWALYKGTQYTIHDLELSPPRHEFSFVSPS